VKLHTLIVTGLINIDRRSIGSSARPIFISTSDLQEMLISEELNRNEIKRGKLLAPPKSTSTKTKTKITQNYTETKLKA
tara:strand:- start:369 stop:605 length:237 start_codon:yes stop_codon:yes gene_type:complete